MPRLHLMASSCNRKTNPSAQPPKPAAPSKTEFQNRNASRGSGNASPIFCYGRRADLAVFLPVGDNLRVTIMRLACGLEIDLWLSTPAAGRASGQHDPAGSAQ